MRPLGVANIGAPAGTRWSAHAAFTAVALFLTVSATASYTLKVPHLRGWALAGARYGRNAPKRCPWGSAIMAIVGPFGIGIGGMTVVAPSWVASASVASRSPGTA